MFLLTSSLIIYPCCLFKAWLHDWAVIRLGLIWCVFMGTDCVIRLLSDQKSCYGDLLCRSTGLIWWVAMGTDCAVRLLSDLMSCHGNGLCRTTVSEICGEPACLISIGSCRIGQPMKSRIDWRTLFRMERTEMALICFYPGKVDMYGTVPYLCPLHNDTTVFHYPNLPLRWQCALKIR